MPSRQVVTLSVAALAVVAIGPAVYWLRHSQQPKPDELWAQFDAYCVGMSQPRRPDGRHCVRHDVARSGGARAGDLRGRRSQAARRPDAAARLPAAFRGDARVARELARDLARCGRGGAAESRARLAASFESHRVRERDQRPIRSRRRRRGAAAERRRERRLRQRGERAEGIAVVPRAVHLRRRRDQRDGGRQPAREAWTAACSTPSPG